MKARDQKQQQQQNPAQETRKAAGVEAETCFGEMIKVALKQLALSAANVRVRPSNPKRIEKLANNIAAEGLLENLVVIEGKKKGAFEVVAGGRRLSALQLLVERKVLANDALIDCKKIPRERAIGASLAENHEREDMHPADQCEAFKALVREGNTEAEIAARFDVTKGVVRERLAMADVAVEVIAKWREDSLSMAQVEAFTVTSNHDKQRTLVQRQHIPAAHEIKRQLTECAVSGTDRRAKFIGEKAYKKAGGEIRRDLFAQGRADGLYFMDAGLLEQLALTKLESHAEDLRDEWSWVEVRTEFSYSDRSKFGSIPTIRIEPNEEQAEQIAALKATADAAATALQAAGDEDEDEDTYTALWEAEEAATEALEAAKAELDRPDPRATELAGVVVTLNYSGEVETLTGLIRAEDKAKLRGLENPKLEVGKTAAAPGQADTASLTLQLSALRTLAIQEALADNPDTALRVLAFTLLQDHVADGVSACVGVEIRANNDGDEVSRLAREVAPNADVIERMEERAQTFTDQLPDSAEALWQWCMVEATTADIQRAIAFVVARSVDGVQRWAHAKDRTAPLAKHLQLDMRQHWTPHAGYFARLRKSDTLAMLDASGKSDVALARLKRDALAAQAAQRLAGIGWLPPTLRTTA